MHITGEKDGTPVKVSLRHNSAGDAHVTQVGVAVTDILTGHYAFSGILAGLLKRTQTGKGSRVEASLFESQVSPFPSVFSTVDKRRSHPLPTSAAIT